MKSKNALGCPIKSPIAVKNFKAPMAAPFVSVGRMTEHFGRLRLRKGHGSGMIRLVVNDSPPKGDELRFGNINPFVGSVRGAKETIRRRQLCPTRFESAWFR